MSATANAHGLDGTLVAPDWPPLTQNEVRGVLRGFDSLAGPVELLSVSPRPFSAASVVRAGSRSNSRRVFVKRHARQVRDAAGLAEEHAFMAHLRTRGASVPRVLADSRGRTAIEIDDQFAKWTYEVHELPRGIDLYEDAISWTPFFHAAHARAAGRALAQLHLASEGFDAPARTHRPLVAGFSIFAAQNPHEALQSYLSARPELHAYLERTAWLSEAMDLLAPFHAELRPLLPALTPLWTHNDLHPSNLFWSGSGSTAHATAVIDFGLSDRTTAVHDLAHAIERSIIEWLALVQSPHTSHSVPVHFNHLSALLEGYESVRPLSAEERAALAPLAALCHVEFALSEADYFLSVLHSREKAHYACPAYLLDHARWWRGAGAALLDKIRAWTGVSEA
jgi:Ser/Thr protein kinase RdoA (MazF antagonist)